MLYARDLRFSIGNKAECDACAVLRRRCINMGDRGHHEYNPTDVCVRTPNQALT